MEKKQLSNVEAIKLVMEKDGGRQVTMEEFKALSIEDRQELGDLCRAEILCQQVEV